jgi:hypothetical protein
MEQVSQIEQIIETINKIDPKVFSDEQYMSQDGYLNRVCRFMQKMQPCKIYKVTGLATPETEELFIEVVKFLIIESFSNVSFLRDDYKEFRKN